MQRSNQQLIDYGSEQPLPQRRVLRAGPLTAVLEGADLRYIRCGEHEVLRRVYVAVRDHNWGTVAATLSNLHIDSRDDGFEVTFDARHAEGTIDFAWRGTIAGRADGTISYVMDGRARSTFAKNRIGLCVLHPMDCAGLPCRVQHSDGALQDSTFPRYIAPHQPFRDVSAISHEAAPGVHAEVRLDGDVFEMEDQRNWTDASFKLYSTPLDLPFPVEVTAGTAVKQSFELRVSVSRGGAVAQTIRPAQPAAPLSFTLLTESSKMPAIGLCLGSGGLPDGWELERLRALKPAHLRLELDLADVDAPRRLLDAAGLGLPLLVALFAGDDQQHELAALRVAVAQQHLPIAAWLIFDRQHKVTGEQTIRLAREVLGPIAPGAPIGAGTNAYFAELNRLRPPIELLDLVAYSINPQVHAGDNASLVENLAAQAATVESARRFCGGRGLAVGPVTLKPRFNPDATGPRPVPVPGALPPEVDARQLSLLGAGWTVGSLKYLAEAGAACISYYEVGGRRGLMEGAAAPAREPHGGPEAFPTQPRMLFPLYHVLADAGEFASGQAATVVHSKSSDPLAVDGLVLNQAGRRRILLANFDTTQREVVLHRLSGDSVRLRMLDRDSYAMATLDGAAFREQRGERRILERGTLRLQLPSYAVVTIDGET